MICYVTSHHFCAVRLWLAVAVISLFWALPTGAQEYCFEEAGKQYKISSVLLRAISEVESNFNPNAFNVNGNQTYDYCHMQINSSWANTIGMETWASLSNPCNCTMVGAWILSTCIENYGNTWEAVGCYHAKKNTRRIQYAWKIHDALKSYPENGHANYIGQ